MKNAIKLTGLVVGYLTALVTILFGADAGLGWALTGFVAGGLTFGLSSYAIEREV